MSQIADILIDIEASTPADQKPTVRPILAAIMREQMAIDWLAKQSVQLMLDEHATEVAELKAEITQYGELLNQAEIRVALAKLCRRHRVDPGIVERLSPYCRYDDGGLTIMDEYGVPTTFREAVCDLEDK